MFSAKTELVRHHDIKKLTLHVYSIFACMIIKMQWLPLILNGKSTDKALFCLYEEIYFICYLFIWFGACFKISIIVLLFTLYLNVVI